MLFEQVRSREKQEDVKLINLDFKGFEGGRDCGFSAQPHHETRAGKGKAWPAAHLKHLRRWRLK